jgi:hypothetical protein
MGRPPRSLLFPAAKTVLLSAAVSLSSCEDSGSRSRLSAELEAARARWEAANLSNYALSERRSCFCNPPFEWTVVVRGESSRFIESVSIDGSSDESERTLAARALERSMSVEEAFDWIEQRLDRADGLEVAFDSERGFPVSISWDVAFAVDDEIEWTFQDLVDLAPVACTEIGCNDHLSLELRPNGVRFVQGTYEVQLTANGATRSCSFRVLDPSKCPLGDCFHGEGCDAMIFAVYQNPERIVIQYPVMETALDISVTRDGVTIASTAIQPVYQRLQPNGPYCPPVCYQAVVELILP